ncbi:universal stress protein [Kineococcus sp. SYSU DK003]|uniref:universal stress protein n=1 Tax=Kineococcus sp. SYSU DK003 TaxID=3383124 RepID=UPI003D7E4C58
MDAGSARTIVVGVDGSRTGESAVVWAARWGLPADARLQLVHCVEESRAGGGRFPPARRAAVAAGRQALATAAELARQADASRTLVEEFSWHSPRVELLPAAGAADLVVVGTRGRRKDAPLFGSTARYLADHSAVPVAFVPVGAEEPTGAPGVTVGLDGSPASEEAVTIAARYAAAAGAVLELVGIVSLEAPGVPTRPGNYVHRLEAAERHRVDQVDAALARIAATHPGLVTRTRIVEGAFASDALLQGWSRTDGSEGCGLVVTGHRGRGAFLSALFGSTTTTLVRRCPVPLIVVPAPVPAVLPDAVAEEGERSTARS